MPPSDLCRLLDPLHDKTCPNTGYKFTFPQSPASILRPPTRNSISCEELLAIWSTPPAKPEPTHKSETKPIHIACCSSQHFKKYARNQAILCIWYTTNDKLEIRINAISNHLPPDIPSSEQPPPEPPPSSTTPTLRTSKAFVSETEDEIHKLIPKQYHNYLNVFDPVEVKKLPDHQPYDIAINIEDGKQPSFGPIYSLSQDERETLFEYIKEQLAKRFIRRSTSSAASPILFVCCKTGDLHLCVDYCGLNTITKKNRYPLPLTSDLLDRVQGCDKFMVIDLKNAFNLIRVKEGDEWKTAFCTHLGLFEYTVMPFGLTNTPATFQAFIQDVLRNILDIWCIVYLDDILIFSRPGENHETCVAAVLERLSNANLFANAKKCKFRRSQVEYLGYIISANSIQMNPKKLDTISKWPMPSSVKQIQ